MFRGAPPIFFLHVLSVFTHLLPFSQNTICVDGIEFAFENCAVCIDILCLQISYTLFKIKKRVQTREVAVQSRGMRDTLLAALFVIVAVKRHMGAFQWHKERMDANGR